MRFFIFIYFLSTNLLLNAQGWRSRHQVPQVDEHFTRCIYETTPGNYMGLGYSYSFSNINNNFGWRLWAMGMNGQGQVLWEKQYGDYNALEYSDFPSFYTNYGYKQGNYLYYTCYVMDRTIPDTLMVYGALLKFDFNGDTVWTKTYRDTAMRLFPQRVTGSVDGGFLISGYLASGTISGSPLVLIKTDANGNELWRKIIHKTTVDSSPDVIDCPAILQDSASKKIVLAGYQNKGNSLGWSGYDCVLILDSLGNTLAHREYMNSLRGGSWSDLVQTPDKKFVAVGAISTNTLDSYGDPVGAPIAVKFDLNSAAFEWRSFFNNPDDKVGGNTAVLLPDGNIEILSAEAINDSTYSNNSAVRLLRINSNNGQVLRNRYYDYNSYIYDSVIDEYEYNFQSACGLSRTSDGGFVTAIEMIEPQSAFFFVKYDENGCDSTLAYCDVWLGGEELKVENGELKVYPNPASEILNVELNLTPTLSKGEGAEVEMKIINVVGELIKCSTLTTEHSQIDVSELKSGIYFLQVFERRKLLAVKKVIKE